MKEYANYCTEEQTKKALELGAPIDGISSSTKEDITTIQCVKLDTPIYTDVIDGGFDYAIIPTAEQMINWLESQDDIYDIRLLRFANGDWKYEITTKHIPKNKTYSRCKSKKEATLAAIDAALDYLSNNKEY